MESEIEKAFVTGANSSYLDILNWFITNYNKHIKIPLFIVDFGLKKKFDDRIFINIKNESSTWFYKPLAISKVPSKKIIWLDCDIEIKENISDLFDLLEDCDYLICKDHAVPQNGWQTGIVGIKNKNILGEWIDRCEKMIDRTDQEALNSISSKFKIKQIPDEYHGLRLGKNNKKFKTMHWTGPNGKKNIRDKIYD